MGMRLTTLILTRCEDNAFGARTSGFEELASEGRLDQFGRISAWLGGLITERRYLLLAGWTAFDTALEMVSSYNGF